MCVWEPESPDGRLNYPCDGARLFKAAPAGGRKSPVNFEGPKVDKY